jgi:hypothetical protein
MASLINTKIQDTYTGLIKTADNLPVDGTLKNLEDGNGGVLPIKVSSTTVEFTGNVLGITAGGLQAGTGTDSMASVLTSGPATASNAETIAIGKSTIASGFFANAIGSSASATGGFAQAYGTYCEAGGGYATALGSGCNAGGEFALAVGKQSQAAGASAISIGIENSAAASTSIVIGKSSSCASGQDGGIVIGNASNVKYQGISIGNNISNVSASQGIAIGQGAGTGNGWYATALGYNAKANAQGSTAIGFGVTAATANTVTIKRLQMLDYATLDYADDAAAATGGIPLGGVYHTSGALKIRIA